MQIGKYKFRNAQTLIGLLVCLIVFAGVSVFVLGNLTGKQDVPPSTQDSQAVIEQGGVQYISITAKGGYFPNQIRAKADTPTVLKLVTKNTYGCESAVVISEVGFQEFLPSTGTKEVNLGTQPKGKQVKVTCTMGMYNAYINFI